MILSSPALLPKRLRPPSINATVSAGRSVAGSAALSTKCAPIRARIPQPAGDQRKSSRLQSRESEQAAKCRVRSLSNRTILPAIRRLSRFLCRVSSYTSSLQALFPYAPR